MSETRKKVNLDAALREWPEVEKFQAEWEEKARSVEARLRSVEPATTSSPLSDDRILAAPLGQIAEDGHNTASPEIFAGRGGPMTMQNRERDRRSLQDLARLAQMTPPPPSVSPQSGVLRAAEAKKDDSGIIDLAAAAASDPTAEQRAQTTPLASQGLFDDEPASVRPPPMAQQPYPSVPPPQSVPPQMWLTPSSSLPPVAPAVPSSAPPSVRAATSSQMTSLPHEQAHKKRGKGGQVVAILVGGVVAAAAVAAGVVVYAKHRQPQQAAAMAAAAQPEKPAVMTAAPKADEPKQEVATVDPAPEATVDPAARPSNGKIAMAPKPAAKGGAGKAEPAAKSEPQKELKLAQKDLPQQASGPAGDLGSAIQEAAGSKAGPEQTPAAGTNGPQFASGSVPQKPSQGAVTGAIGAVLSQARACLGPDDPVSYASITFGSNGTVQSVALTGGAAGKPAEACIKGALMKAKVASFAEPTYLARITVRH